MLKSLSHLVFAAATAIVSVGSAHAAPTIIEGFASPESVLIEGDRRFVSNIGTKLDPFGKDGDGFISELSKDGKLLALNAFPAAGEAPLNAPKGMAVAAGKLFVADIDRIVGYDLATGKQAFEAKLPGSEPTLLNDLATQSDAELLVSDTVRGTLYKLSLDTGKFDVVATDMPGANGIIRDSAKNRTFINALGAKFEGGDLFVVEDGKPARKLDNSPHGILDGLALLADGKLLVSDWTALDPKVEGVLLSVPTDGSAVQKIDLGLGIGGPADLAVDPKTGEVWVPSMTTNRVIIAPVSAPGSN